MGAAAAVLCTATPVPLELALDLALPLELELGLAVIGVLTVVPLPDGLGSDTLDDDDASSGGIVTLNSLVMVGAGASSAVVASRFSVEAALSTVKGSPHVDDWAPARDSMERLNRVAMRILKDLDLRREDLGGGVCRR
jgi:hypothetical protein